jgi:hypothetical protein
MIVQIVGKTTCMQMQKQRSADIQFKFISKLFDVLTKFWWRKIKLQKNSLWH